MRIIALLLLLELFLLFPCCSIRQRYLLPFFPLLQHQTEVAVGLLLFLLLLRLLFWLLQLVCRCRCGGHADV